MGRVVYDNKSLVIIEFLLLQILRYAFALETFSIEGLRKTIIEMWMRANQNQLWNPKNTIFFESLDPCVREKSSKSTYTPFGCWYLGA